MLATDSISGLSIGYEDKDFSYSDSDGTKHDDIIDEIALRDVARRPLSRKIPIPSSRINPYRMVILMRVIAIAGFFYFRLRNPVRNGYVLWVISVICEIWFALSWMLDQLPKWFPIDRETYRRRLALRYKYNREVESSQLAFIDIVITTVDPAKEHPIVTANSVLSVLAVDYPVERVSCYVSDDGASFLTFEALHETSEFARKWVPFCKKHGIEPRAPEWYFVQKVDYLRNKVHASFVKDRRAMKRNYEEFKVRINALVAKARKVPDEGWFMRDGTPWPGNRTNDHPGMIQVVLGQCGERGAEVDKLPRLVYVSREKRPGFRHHYKAGAMNALARVSGLLTNGPFLLNLNCDHYISNSKTLQEAMCFLMDPNHAKSLCFVQFPLRFDGVDPDDLYANRNTAFFDINLRALDGIQGPTYIGTGCVFNRRALYGWEAPIKPKRKLRFGIITRCFGFGGSRGRKKLPETKYCESDVVQEAIEGVGYMDEKSELVSQLSLEKSFGHSNVFVESTLLEEDGVSKEVTSATLLKEAIQVISCGYEDDTRWGSEIGWIYGSGSEDFLTGLKMHARGWRSVYCTPKSPAFKGSAPTCLADRLHQVLSWAQGSIRILLSRHCPIWYALGGRLKWLQRLAYINSTVYPLTSIPLTVYCSLPAICLFSGKFIFPQISMPWSITLLGLFLSILATNILEMRWSGVGINEWWRNEQFWVIGSVAAHLFAIFQGLFKSIANININFHSSNNSREIDEISKHFGLKWTSLLVPPTTLLMINLIGILVGFSSFVDSNSQAWSLLFCKMFFALWVIIHLYPFLKGLTSKQNKVPTIVVVWSVLLASIFSLLWVNVNPFVTRIRGPSLEQCGINC